MTLGVALCDCGEKLGKIIDYNALERLDIPVLKLSNLCLDAGIESIKKFVESKSIDKLVVGACTPKFIEYKLRQTLPSVEEFEFVILREQIAWPNKTEPEKATKKAKILLQTAIAGLNAKAKIERENYKVEQSAVIIGGGVAGIQAALDLASDVKVYLIETSQELGGNLRNLGKVFPGDVLAKDIIAQKIEALKTNSNATILTSTKTVDVTGHPGSYNVSVQRLGAEEPEVINCGVIIVATGFEESKPYHLSLGYGSSKNIILQTDLAHMLRDGKVIVPSTGKKPEMVLMGNCINCRDENHFYCSKICCTYSIHHAIELADEGIESAICFMDIRAPYKYENVYREAREKGVTFIRGKLQSVEVGPDNELIVPVENTLTNELYELSPDLIVLSSALLPAEGSNKLAELLGLNLKESCYISDLYSKTNTSQTTQRGIFIAGAAFTPMSIQEAISHASSAAVKALKFLKGETLIRDLLVPVIDEDLCNGCATCRDTCQFHAITMKIQTDTDEELIQVATVDPTICKGCGTCSAVCPTGATQLSNYQRGVIFAKIEGLMKAIKEEKWTEPVIIALTCEECGSCGVDLAGLAGFEYPTNAFTIDVPCAGRIGVVDILKAFVEGADGVMVVHCPEPSCHFLMGSYNVNLMVQFTKNILDEIGFESARLVNVEIVSSDPDKYVISIENLNEIIQKVGSNPNK